MALLGAWQLIDHARGTHAKVRYVAYGAVAVGLFIVLISASRGPLLSLLAGLMVAILVRTGSKTTTAKRLGIVLFGTVLAGAIWFGLPYIQEQYGFRSYSRVSKLFEDVESDQTAEGRLKVWQGAIGQFIGNPMIGDFLVERESGFYPHNALVEAFMATGIIGGIPFLLWFLTVITSAIRLLRSAGQDAWLSLLAVQYLTGSLLSGGLWGDATMWYFGNAVIAQAFFYSRQARRKRQAVAISSRMRRGGSAA